VHVLSDSFASSTNNYLSTYDPALESWMHTPITLEHIGNIADGDLSILGDDIYRRGLRVNVATFQERTFEIQMTIPPSETAAGLDGFLYSISSGSPRWFLQRTDPATFGNLGAEMQLRDASGMAIDGRGLAVTADGMIYVADFDGHIYRFDSVGSYAGRINTRVSNLLEINLRTDGRIVAGNRFGEVVVTDLSFSFVSTFNVGTGLVYTAFVYPLPEPSAGALLFMGVAMMGAIVRRRRQRGAAEQSRRREKKRLPPSVWAHGTMPGRLPHRSVSEHVSYRILRSAYAHSACNISSAAVAGDGKLQNANCKMQIAK
jgi:hypothetical protein